MVLNRVAQSLRAAGGTAFEFVVPALKALIRDRSNLRRLMDFTRVPVKRRCDQTQLEDYPDLDLFALVKPEKEDGLWRLLAIINCKVSFHARHTEATFWGLLVRLSSNIPFVVVTEDRDIYKPKASELGTSCTRSTETRRLLESFSDGIYLVKRYKNINDPKLRADIDLKRSQLHSGIKDIVFDDPDIPNHTRYCHSVRPLDDLIDDLCHWKAEVPL